MTDHETLAAAARESEQRVSAAAQAAVQKITRPLNATIILDGDIDVIAQWVDVGLELGLLTTSDVENTGTDIILHTANVNLVPADQFVRDADRANSWDET